ncbi:hypothetical protein OIO90_003813 [Microbotryomycetes sp. JL221]|nr:hypothetical protein OIO90_003813 [Microbotryomycetes sp. JL221]
MSSTTSSSATPSSSLISSAPITMSASVYYAAIGIAMGVILMLTVGSRIMYIRKAKKRADLERADATRRGEETGLPTYSETAHTYTLSYLPQPRFLNSTRPVASLVPPQQNDAVSDVTLPTRAHVTDGRLRVDDDQAPARPPPGYDGPPKYED